MPTRYHIPNAPVPGIRPVKGWTLHMFVEPDSDGFATDGYFARSALEDVMLDVSRFEFTPTEERFAFLVDMGFPARPSPMGGWNDREIDYALAAVNTADLDRIRNAARALAGAKIREAAL